MWYVFAGMGTQWVGMGRDLLALDIFRESMQRSDAVLRPLGIPLLDLIMSESPKAFDNTLHSFVGLASIQVCTFFCANFLHRN